MRELSIVIAAYNEEKRLPRTLERLFAYLENLDIQYEIIIVDDGSRDRTRELVEELGARRQEVRALSHFPNQGRGASIREGILASRGNFILETDADLSVGPEAIGRFLQYFRAHPGMDAIFGSRELPESTISTAQPFLRFWLGKGFIYLAKLLFWSWHTTDFTLGFKMFRREAADDIFSRQFDNHYVAEAEIVFVAKKRGWKTAELPVVWTDNRDSRVRPFRDSLRSLKGVLLILVRALRGKYT